LLSLSLWSYDLQGGENWIGPVGAGFAGWLVSAVGLAAWAVPIELGATMLHMFRVRTAGQGAARAASSLVFVLIGCALLHLTLGEHRVFGGHLAGGVLGEVLGEVLRSLLGTVGTYVTGVSMLLITAVLRTSLSVVSFGRWLASAGQRAWQGLQASSQRVLEAWREARELERLAREAERKALEPKIVERTGPARRTKPARAAAAGKAAEPAHDAERDEVDEEEPADLEDAAEAGETQAADDPEPPLPVRGRAGARRGGPVIVAPRPETLRRPVKPAPEPPAPAAASKPFVLPPTTLLTEPDRQALEIDEKTLKDNATRLVDKLAAYGVKGRVDEIHPGPVVTMYEFEPASGTKVSKIAGLADDLAMALAAQKVRIVAPIPGKSRVGFELPNRKRQTVFLREILEDERWHALKADLPMAFGKDISGQPVYGDLAKMPHLLVAGATGAGKSVGLNVMLASLLAKKSPDEVKLLMIDPKVVELSVFQDIPHMLLPVVTDMKKASLALKWAVDEMERRYQCFADAGARNITTYNERVEKVLRGEMSADRLAPRRTGKVRAQDPDGEEVLLDPADGEAPDAQIQTPQKLPHVVVVVDEFADLMMVSAKDVEAAIARLAQKARAAGIHVILATQRPSVDVITGMIKANFPSRVAYKVSQREDSKTILGRMGAEQLLGMGDMLMLMPGSSDLKRVHSAFISEDEVTQICDFLRAQGSPVYNNDILKPREDEEEAGEHGGSSSDDPLYDRAVALVAQAGYCSISHIQRHLSVGYNKAAKLVEQMEREGVVGPPSAKAGGRREVLVQSL
jgi:S-DNA-T family DNA segregation ATPase FtsK/SpoIIIE